MRFGSGRARVPPALWWFRGRTVGVRAVSPQRGAWAAWSHSCAGGLFAPRAALAGEDSELCWKRLLPLLCYFPSLQSGLGLGTDLFIHLPTQQGRLEAPLPNSG